jgi:putative ABC transport system substrate-binding protein
LAFYTSCRERRPNSRLFDGLRRQGFIEGRNLAVDPRGFGSSAQQYQERVTEMVQSGANVIFVGGDAAMRAAQEATRTVPIIGVADDMVGSGLAASLARPGGNVTGFSILATELDGKRQDLLMELVPDARQMAVLFDPATKSLVQLGGMVDAARSRGIEVSTHSASKVEEIVPAFRQTWHRPEHRRLRWPYALPRLGRSASRPERGHRACG